MAKNLSHSIKSRLLNLSDHDNRRYQQLLIRYIQERFLYRLSLSKYCNNFILKGGALLYAYDEFLPRPTLDVDFMGANISNDKIAITNAFKEIASIEIVDGIRFLPECISVSDIAVGRKYPGVRITMVAFLDTVKKNLVFDIGFGDVAIPKPKTMHYPTIIKEMDAPRITVCPLETVVAEKLQTIVEKNLFNSRMKDFFDLYRIITAHKFDEAAVIEAIKATFDNRLTSLDDINTVLSEGFANDSNLCRRWTVFCNKINIKHAMSFTETMTTIRQFINPLSRKLEIFFKEKGENFCGVAKNL